MGCAARESVTMPAEPPRLRRPDSAALWAVYLALFAMDSSMADLRAMTATALRHAPFHPPLWRKFASLQQSLTQRAATLMRCLRIACKGAAEGKCKSGAVIEGALALLSMLSEARDQVRSW